MVDIKTDKFEPGVNMPRSQTYVSVLMKMPASFDGSRFIFDLRKASEGFRNMNFNCQRPMAEELWITKVVLRPEAQQLNGALRIRNAASIGVTEMSALFSGRVRAVIEASVRPGKLKQDQFPMISYKDSLAGFTGHDLRNGLLHPEIFGYLYFSASKPGQYRDTSELLKLQTAKTANGRLNMPPIALGQVTRPAYHSALDGTLDQLIEQAKREIKVGQ
jgi:hypothetical protein